MKASLRWIEEFVDLPTRDPGVIAAAFDGLGLEVEGVTRVEADFRGVVVARVGPGVIHFKEGDEAQSTDPHLKKITARYLFLIFVLISFSIYHLIKSMN